MSRYTVRTRGSADVGALAALENDVHAMRRRRSGGGAWLGAAPPRDGAAA